ncbi:MAG TPA: hypothetical protein DHV28_08505 [Ignavibacteriales bacterium]|nr:hypothetical protein [Ignavibacteriales bacterium]
MFNKNQISPFGRNDTQTKTLNNLFENSSYLCLNLSINFIIKFRLMKRLIYYFISNFLTRKKLIYPKQN